MSNNLTVLTNYGREKNGWHFADDIFECIFSNENVWILNTIWLKFVLKSPIDNNTALVQIMAWCQFGAKPLSEPMLTWFIDAYMQYYGEMSRHIAE